MSNVAAVHGGRPVIRWIVRTLGSVIEGLALVALVWVRSGPVRPPSFYQQAEAYACALVVACVVAFRVISDATARRGPLQRWRLAVTAASAVISVVAVSALLFTDVAAQIRFTLSLPALEIAAQEAQDAGPSGGAAPQWIGLYRVTQIQAHGGRVEFTVAMDDLIGSEVLVYSSTPLPGRSLAAGWYAQRHDP